MSDAHGTLHVLITSIDGNVSHPFRRDQTIDDVRRFGYERLVQDKGQVQLNATWIEYDGQRVDNGKSLNGLVGSEKQGGKPPDITLNLAWTSQGGC